MTFASEIPGSTGLHEAVSQKAEKETRGKIPAARCAARRAKPPTPPTHTNQSAHTPREETWIGRPTCCPAAMRTGSRWKATSAIAPCRRTRAMTFGHGAGADPSPLPRRCKKRYAGKQAGACRKDVPGRRASALPFPPARPPAEYCSSGGGARGRRGPSESLAAGLRPPAGTGSVRGLLRPDAGQLRFVARSSMSVNSLSAFADQVIYWREWLPLSMSLKCRLEGICGM